MQHIYPNESLISISKGIDVGSIRVLQDVPNQTLPVCLLPLILLIKLFVVVEQDLLVQQV
jgi:hypothetical protein